MSVPHIVPGPGGDIQIEFYTPKFNVEISVNDSREITIYKKDHMTNDEFYRIFNLSDLETMVEWILE